MQWGKEFLRSVFGRDEEAALSRRDILGGLGLAGLLAAAPKLFASSPAEARALDKPAAAPTPETNATDTQGAEEGAVDLNAEGSEVTDLSSQYWRRRRRRYWRRRWRRRYWRRRYWRPYARRRRYWRRRYWRRRYWY